MRVWLSSVWAQISFLFEHITWADFLDIFIVAIFFILILKIVRNTRAAQITRGIAVLILLYALAKIIPLKTVSFALQAVLTSGILVLAIIFQPELRRMVEQLGTGDAPVLHFFTNTNITDVLRTNWKNSIISICDSAESMADERTGALIVIERKTNLNEIIRTGTLMESDITPEVLGTVFYEGTPLHDGAVIVRDAKIEAAACFLPLSNNLDIGKEMGTRHRAALGMSENSDAIVVVVSEETGIISLARNGVIIRRLDRQNLYDILMSEIIPPEVAKKKKKKIAFLNREDKKIKKGKKNEKK